MTVTYTYLQKLARLKNGKDIQCDKTCSYKSNFIKINHTGSHYQLVDSERPCSCGGHKGERQSVRLRDRKANKLESNINEHPSILQQEEQSPRNGEYGPTSEPTEDLTWNGRQGKEFENLINSIYEEIIYFKKHSIFEPSQSNTLGQLVKEMMNLITHYSADAPTNKLALKIIMILPSLLLQKLHPKAKAQGNNEAFKRRMKLWADGKFELISEAKAIQKRLDNYQHKQRGETDKARLFRLKMENGQIRQAARLLEHEESGGLILLNEETLRKLKEKHPLQRPSCREREKQSQPVIYKRITGEMVRRAAIETKGVAGPSGMDTNTWQKLLTSRKNPSSASDLREAIANLARKMCTEDCKYLQPFISNRLVPLKAHSNDVLPIGIGEVLQRIIGMCVMDIAKEDIQKAVGNFLVCAGQHAGAEAAIHAMRELYDDKECEAVLLVDASNACNTLNRKTVMHNNDILCPTLATFVQNTYRQPAHLILSDGSTMTSEEGTTRGDPMVMAMYALDFVALQEKIGLKNTEAKHVAYADDLIGAGNIKALRKWWDNITQHGPPLGYRPNAAKSSLIVKNEHKELAENIFERTNVIIRTDGAKHLGAVIGTSDYKETFIKNLVSQWVNELRELTKIAKSEPQAAYSNFMHSLRQKWNFAVRTIPGLENYLLPL